MAKKNIAIGTQLLSKLIKGNNVYVDKTKYIFNLIKNPANCNFFISRPRRWGKSLTIDTIKEIFLGNKELFKGLDIYNLYQGWDETYPVILISFAGFTPNEDNNNLLKFLEDKTEIFINDKVLKVKDFINPNEFKNLKYLIDEVYNKTGKEVVILIDEYDSPFTKNLDNNDFIKIRDFFSKFYSAIKDIGRKIRFFYLSGLTKVAQTSLFSTMNNLNNITFDINYNRLIGYSLDEIKFFFKDHIITNCNELKITEEELFNKLKEYYDGYYFGNDNDRLYNAWSINCFFDKKSFDYYWAETGDIRIVDTILKKITLDEYLQFVKDLLNNKVNQDEEKELNDNFTNFSKAGFLTIENNENINIKGILLQAGYLTYRDKKIVIANEEAKATLIGHFLDIVTGMNNKGVDEIINIRDGLYKGIIEGNAGKCEMALNKIKRFKDDPSDWTAKNPEGVMKSIISLFLDIAPFENLTKEEGHDGGKTDIVLYHRGKHYIIETKIAKNNDDKSAIEQIDKQYLSSFQGKEGYKIGITLYPKREENKISVVMEKL